MKSPILVGSQSSPVVQLFDRLRRNRNIKARIEIVSAPYNATINPPTVRLHTHLQTPVPASISKYCGMKKALRSGIENRFVIQIITNVIVINGSSYPMCERSGIRWLRDNSERLCNATVALARPDDAITNGAILYTAASMTIVQSTMRAASNCGKYCVTK